MKLREKVNKVMSTTTYTDKNGDVHYNRDLILITEEAYPKEIAVTFKDGNCKLLDALNPGDIVEVTLDIQSREYNGRYFTSLNAWKLDIIKTVVDNTQQAADTPPTAPVSTNGNVIIPQ